MSVSVSAATDTTPIKVSTTPNHGLSTGDTVIIYGVPINPAANGTWTITVLTSSQFSLNGSAGSGHGDSGGGGTVLTSEDVTNATNATPIVITTATAHGFLSGFAVAIAGILGNVAANGQWLITKVDATNFSLNGSAGSGAYTSGGTAKASAISYTISNATNATPIVITSTNPHGLVTGNMVTILGVGGNTAANGKWFVVVIDDTNFSIIDALGNNVAGNGGYTSGGSFSINMIERTVGTRLIKENSALVGTGAITLLGPAGGFYPFSILGDGAVASYTIFAVDAKGNPTGQSEAGSGKYTASTNTVSRDTLASTSESADPTSPENFAAGPKFVTGELKEAADGGGITLDSPFMGSCCLSPNRVAVFTQANREGKSGTVYLVPVVNSATDSSLGYITLLYVANNVGPDGVRTTIREFFNVPLSLILDPNNVATSRGFTAGGECDMKAASAIPFAYNAGMVATQNGIREKIPADVFAYLPSRPPGVQLPADMAMFYLNWQDANTRGFGVTNLTTSGLTVRAQSYLDTSGAWITETDPLLKDANRYLYVGTVAAANSDDTTHLPINQIMYRLIWSKQQRFPFQDLTRDVPVPRPFELVTEWYPGANLERMNAHSLTPLQSDGTQASTWRHFGLSMDASDVRAGASFSDMDTSLNPYFRMQCDVRGGVYVRIASGDGTPCITPNGEASARTTSENALATLSIPRCILDRLSTQERLGFQIWAVQQWDRGGPHQFSTIYSDNVQRNIIGGQSGACFFQVSGEN